jgi:tetratricopeptide (TPR) repeat protein
MTLGNIGGCYFTFFDSQRLLILLSSNILFMKRQILIVLAAMIGLILLLWLLNNELKLISISTISGIRDELLDLLEIVALCLLILVLIIIVRWLLRPPDGTVILPFEIVIPDDRDKLKYYNGKSIADSLMADMSSIAAIHKQDQGDADGKNTEKKKETPADFSSSGPEQADGHQNQEKAATNKLIRPKTDEKITLPEFKSVGENLNPDFADIANIVVSGNNISIGRLLITMKKFWKDRDPKCVISGSLQKYGDMIRLVCRLKVVGESIVICDVHKKIESEDEIPSLIKDLSFKIWQEISKSPKDNSTSGSNTWLGLKYFTEALNSYNKYKSSRTQEHLDKACDDSLKAYQEEKGYKSLYPLCYNLGKELYQLAQYDKAQEQFKCAGDIVYEAYPQASDEFKNKAADAHYAYGLCHMYLKHFPDAEFSFRRVIDFDPNGFDGYYRLSLVLSYIGREDESRDVFKKAFELKLIDTENFSKMGDWLYDLGLRTEALNEYEKAKAKEPGNMQLYIKCGNIHTDEEDYKDALDQYNQALDLNTETSFTNLGPHNDLGYVYNKLNQPDNARIQFDLAMHQNPSDPLPHFNLGCIYTYSDPDSKIQDDKKAIKEFDRTIQLDPNYVNAYFNLGKIYERNRDFEKAIQNFQAAKSLDPNVEEFHIELAYSYFSVDQFDNAEREYKKALELNPNNYDTHSGLGYLYRRKGDYPMAILAFRNTTRLAPDYSYSYMALGGIYRYLKDWDQAIRAYREAIRIRPEYPVSYLCMAHCYREKGDVKQFTILEKKAESVRKKSNMGEYDSACYEAIRGNAEMSISLLRIALQKRVQTVDYVNKDNDFDSIRNEPEFKILIDQYTPYYISTTQNVG